MITDGNEVVMRLLERNKIHLHEDNISNHTNVPPPRCSFNCHQLIWGFKLPIKELIELQGTFEVIIGADIILWPMMVIPLVQTLRWILSCNAFSAVAYISYVLRAHSTTSLFLQTADQYGLKVDRICADRFIPAPIPRNLSSLEKFIFRITIRRPEGISFESEPEVFSSDAEDVFTRCSTAC